MSKWASYTVAQLQGSGWLLVEDGNHGEYRPRAHEFGIGSTAFIRAADIDDGRVRFETASIINDVALARIRKGIGRGGDILFSHKGTVGKIARIPLNAPPFVCSPQTTFWRTLDEERLDRGFLFAYMRSRAFRDQWTSRKGETDMADYVSLTAQRELLVSLPRIDEQRAIGAFLGALDEKIELNREMNRTLEATAQVFFKSWFVDFDPVLEKIAGEPSGLTGHLDQAIPRSFAPSELGEIPVGWRVGLLGDVITLQRGFDLPSARRRPGPYRVIAASGDNGKHDECKVKGPGVTTGRSGVIGRVYYVHEDFWPLNTSLWVTDFKQCKAAYAFHLLNSLDLSALID